jgi:hypothetical protein
MDTSNGSYAGGVLHVERHGAAVAEHDGNAVARDVLLRRLLRQMDNRVHVALTRKTAETLYSWVDRHPVPPTEPQ